jgi:hypothetical protein
MKKQIILIVSLIISLSSLSQHSIKPIKTTSPCNDAMLMKITGEWHQFNNISPGFMGLTVAQIQEGIKRLDAIHKLVQEVYPNPTALLQAGFIKHSRQNLQTRSGLKRMVVVSMK